MGGGSSAVKPHYIATPLGALGKKLPGTQLMTSRGCQTHKYIPEADQRLLVPDLNAREQGLHCRFFSDTVGGNLVNERYIAHGTIMLGGMGNGTDLQGMLAEGYYLPKATGEYIFGLLSTGKARMYVGDELLIDNWSEPQPGDAFFTQGSTELVTTVALEADTPVSFKVEFAVNPTNTFKALRYGILPPDTDGGIEEAVQLARQADAVVLLVGTNDNWETEGNDRQMLELPGEQNILIDQVLAANPNCVVINNSGSPIAMPWLDQAPAVIHAWFAGREFGHALADILLGDISPSGKLPVTFPKPLQDTPAYTAYPGEFGKVYYGEGLFVGYRWYDTRDIEPLLAFGHGLTYIQFEYADLNVIPVDDHQHSFIIIFVVKNVGQRAGMETAQVYIEAYVSPVARAKQELKAFVKVDIASGVSEQVHITLNPTAFEYWDIDAAAWQVAAGQYRIHIDSSSRDIRLTADVVI